MKRVLLLVGVMLVIVAYLVALAFFAPRQVYVFMLIPSLLATGYTFAKKKARTVTTICIVVVAAVFAVAPIDFRVVAGKNRKGVFFLPIDYGIAPRSVDQGYCPGGCIVDHPTHAIVLRI
ncbi:MAG: hypothetical protein U1F61_17095 [Opitutaceae bacterium]